MLVVPKGEPAAQASAKSPAPVWSAARLARTRIHGSAAGLAALVLLAVALAGCGDETVARNNREAAEWTLQLGGNIRISGRDVAITAASQLPEGTFYVEQIDLNNTKTNDKDLEKLPPLGYLSRLGLYGTKITDRSMPRIAELKSLEVLELSKTAVTDAGVEKLTALTDLEKLFLNGTRVTSSAVENLRSELSGCKIIHLR